MRERRVPLRPPLQPDQPPDRLREDRLVHADTPQLLGEVERGLVAAVAVLLERGLDDDLQIRGDRRVRRPRIRRVLRQDLLVEALPRRRLERPPQRQALVERDPERIHVGPPVEPDPLRRDLLGGHVGRGPGHVARDRQRHVASLDLLREAEVEDHGIAILRDHDVAGLDVPVDDAVLVGGVEGASRLLEEEEDLGDLGPRPGAGRRVARGFCRLARLASSPRSIAMLSSDSGPVFCGRDLPGQRFALDVAHRDPEGASILADLVDRADARVVELRRDLGLAPEPLDRLLVGDGTEVEDLQRDLAVEARVLGEVDGRLPAATELANDPVGTDAAAEGPLASSRGVRGSSGIALGRLATGGLGADTTRRRMLRLPVPPEARNPRDYGWRRSGRDRRTALHTENTWTSSATTT